MKKSCIAILTYRRVNALTAMLDGLERYCGSYQTAIFEDCGQRDTTSDFLTAGRKPVARPELMCTQYTPTESADVNIRRADVFMGTRNLGVAGNSNRALKWFMDSDCDHLLLCNDDLHVLGDFAAYYGKAHADLCVGMFCFCDFDHHPSYKWTTYPFRGYRVKFLPRFTGIMISITRELVEKIGYFDARFGKFGEEHCDYTIRARLAGGIRLNDQDMNCLDVEHGLLKHQDVDTSVTGHARRLADQEASVVMEHVSKEYRYRHYYQPFRLAYPRMGGGYRGAGIPTERLLECGYTLVTDLV